MLIEPQEGLLFSGVHIAFHKEIESQIDYEVEMPLFDNENYIKVIYALRNKLKDKYDISYFSFDITEAPEQLVKCRLSIWVYDLAYTGPEMIKEINRELDQVCESFLPDDYAEVVAEACKKIRRLIGE